MSKLNYLAAAGVIESL